MSPLNAYITLYQYFDAQETILIERIEQLQTAAIYRRERKLTAEEAQELAYCKIKLEFLRKIGSELLQLFQHL